MQAAPPLDPPTLLRWTFPVGLLQCNCTVLAEPDSRSALVVDPGDDVSRILDLLRQQRLHLRAVAVTHAHIDHIGGAARLKAATGAPLLLHPSDQFLYARLDEQAAWIGVPPPSSAAVDAALSEHEPLVIGALRFEVMETPGHTPGSCCLYLPAAAHLFAGDTLFAGSIGRTDLPGGNTARILRSLKEKVLALPDTTLVIPGHGPETTLAVERGSNPYLQGL